MRYHKLFLSIVFGAAIGLSGIAASHADEQAGRAADEPSIFERYTSSAQDLVLKGLELVGINYRRGGTNPDTGLDCSGFVQLVYKESIGKLLPRTAKEQSQVGDVIDKKELKAGDLVFFNTMRRAFSTPSLSFHGPSPAVRFMIRFRSSIRNTSPAPLTALAAMSDSLSESISARTTPLVRPVALSIKGIPMDT